MVTNRQNQKTRSCQVETYLHQLQRAHPQLTVEQIIELVNQHVEPDAAAEADSGSSSGGSDEAVEESFEEELTVGTLASGAELLSEDELVGAEVEADGDADAGECRASS